MSARCSDIAFNTQSASGAIFRTAHEGVISSRCTDEGVRRTSETRGWCSGSTAPLQGDGGGSTPTPPHQYIIREIDHKTARDFVERWHYSHRIPTGKNLCYGLYGDGLYAVIVYGIGVNPYQARFLGVEKCLELKRMCRREPKEDYQLSRFIRLTIRFLGRKERFGAIVAFADPEQGHEGTVYKASGFEYRGLTAPEWHLVGADGIKRHRRFAYRMAKREGISTAEARDKLGMKRIQTAPKHRWVLISTTSQDSEVAAPARSEPERQGP